MAANPLHFFAVLLGGLAFVSYISLTWNAQYLYAQYFTAPPAGGSAFDFIVVGSGSAGSVVTRRLAEAGHKILLVEAGGPSHWLSGVPSMTPYFMGSEYDWQFEMEPTDKVGQAFSDRTMKIPRGKVLGGSSMLNWMHHYRPHSADFDEWERMGNPGWGYKDVLPFFKKFEDFVGDVDDKDKYHGVGGPLATMFTPNTKPINDIYQAAFRELGHPEGDVNGALEDGGVFGPNRTQVFQKGGWRMGSYRSFVEPVLGKLDITVLPFSTATRVLFDEHDPKSAIGVQVSRFGDLINYYSTKETVLSAGAVGSPHLLMVSGVGPAEHLASAGIGTRANLPGVGQNLQDHVMSFMTFVSSSETGLSASPFAALNPLNFLRHFLFGDGPLADNGLGTNAAVHTKIHDREKDPRPDMQYHMTPFSWAFDYGIGLASKFSISQENYKATHSQYEDGYSSGMFFPSLLRPRTRGSLKIRSGDVADPPVMDNVYLEDPLDVRTLIEASKYAYAMEETEAFKRYGLKNAAPDTKNCGQHAALSDAYWECYVRHWSGTIYHQAGTCKMGPDSDPGAVVDSRLRVRGGVAGLRVVDASVMPNLVGSNTHSPTTMIGERGADFIVRDWEDKTKANDGKKKSRDEL